MLPLSGEAVSVFYVYMMTHKDVLDESGDSPLSTRKTARLYVQYVPQKSILL
jgi:hypothetical protein